MPLDGSLRRQRLRRATQSAHARLDALIGDAALLSSPERYETYLQATWMARRPCELALTVSNVVELYPIWPQRSVCDALGLDIADISYRQPMDYPRWFAPAVQLGAAQALGVLYVLEGSALGARLLEKRALSIGMTPTFGARHMARQTALPKAWSQFMEVLEKADLSASEEVACSESAIKTFQAFETAFSQAANDQ